MEFSPPYTQVLNGIIIFPTWDFPALPVANVKESIVLKGTSTQTTTRLGGTANQDEGSYPNN